MNRKAPLFAALGCSAFLAGCPANNEICGDEILNATEQCDDGNNTDGDGCSAQCENENIFPDSPSALLAVDDNLFVGLIRLDETFTPGEGALLVMDPANGSQKNLITTSAPQPQFLAEDGTNLYVFNSGKVVFDENFSASVEVAGSIDIFPLAGIEEASAPESSLDFGLNAADATQGSLARAAIRQNGTVEALIGSGLSGDAYFVNLTDGEILRGVDNPISVSGLDSDFINVTARGNDFYALSFSSDQACVAQDPLAGFACQDLGQFPIDDPAGFEGLLNIAFTDNGAFLAVFAVASSFAAGTVNADGSLTITNRGSTGVDPERVISVGNDVFVANAVDNNLTKFTLAADGTATPTAQFVILPAGSNPRDLAVSGDVLFIAAQSGDFVGAFDLLDGEEQALFPIFP
jgi:cysteine-rich repeat protein